MFISTIYDNPYARRPKKKRRRHKKIKEIEARRRMPYHKFLETEYWHSVRIKKITMVGGRCQQCGSNEDIQVHHKTYHNRGDELRHLGDLMVLCSSCHSRIHGRARHEN